MSDRQAPDPEPPHLPGVDGAGQQCFARYWHPIQQFLVTYLSADLEWTDILSHETREVLYLQFVNLEKEVCQSSSPDIVERSNGRRKWLDIYLLPLAKQLGLIEKAHRVTLRLCWMHGRFDQLDSSGRRKIRPQLEAIIGKIQVSLKDNMTSKRRISMLVDQNICRDRESAQIVVKKLDLVEERAASEARGMLLAALKYGWIGPIRHSTYPCAEELCLLQDYIDHVIRLSPQPHNTLGLLRADIIALYWTLHSIEPQLKLWKQNLLHEPPNSAMREGYCRRLSPEILLRIISDLSQRRNCHETEATTLFSIFTTGGLLKLIEWRCSIDNTALQRTLAVQRIEEEIAQHLGGLVPATRQEITRLVVHLYDAAAEVKVSLPIIRLLSEYPSSQYRLRIGRRLSFGFPSMLRRRRRPYRPGRKSAIRRQRTFKHRVQSGNQSPEDQLVVAFARRAGLATTNNNKDAHSRLRYFLTYGGIGMLPKEYWSTLEDWAKLIDSRLVGYIYFFKLGKLDGALDWTLMLQRLKAYAESLGTGAPSLQLTKAIFNSLSKPPRWHGGEGEAVALVRQRATLILNAPRLHETWVVLPLKSRLRLHIVNESGQPVNDGCDVVIIFDKASERPVGCWASSGPIDIGLGLYQSIWHPGALYWPLRGIPDSILVPQSLLKGHRADLERAAEWMLATVKPLSSTEKSRLLDTMPYADELLHRMVLDIPGYIRRRFGAGPMTTQQALEAIQAWIMSEETDVGAGNCFPAHRRSLIPPECSNQGMLMPAHDSPTAGWLLPVVDRIASGRNKVVYRGMAYTASDFRIEPGTKLNIRAFPYLYERMPLHIFVETEDGHLYYLTAHL